MHLLFPLLFALLIHTGSAAADTVSAEKRADIQTLLELTGALKLGQQMSNVFVAQMTQALKANRPDIPARMYDVLAEEVNAVVAQALPDFNELIVPIYDKHFSAQDIKGLIGFYSTDLGRKTVRVMPLLLQDSMAQGQQWGQSLGPEIERRVRERFKAEGIDLSS